MDIENRIMHLLTHPVILYPVLWVFGFTSRIAWDYFRFDKLPTKKKMASLFVMAGFATVLTVLVMTSVGINKETMRWAIPMSAFFGHNLLTALMENQEAFFNAVKEKIKKKLK